MKDELVIICSNGLAVPEDLAVMQRECPRLGPGESSRPSGSPGPRGTDGAHELPGDSIRRLKRTGRLVFGPGHQFPGGHAESAQTHFGGRRSLCDREPVLPTAQLRVELVRVLRRDTVVHHR